MGLLDFFTPNAADGSAPLLGQPQASSQVTPAQQNWMNALGVISAGLRDAGAYLQHQPQAADNVAALARRNNGLHAPGAIASVLARLPPMITTALLLNAARQKQAVQPQSPATAVQQPQTGGAAAVTGPILVTDPNRPGSSP